MPRDDEVGGHYRLGSSRSSVLDALCFAHLARFGGAERKEVPLCFWVRDPERTSALPSLLRPLSVEPERYSISHSRVQESRDSGSGWITPSSVFLDGLTARLGNQLRRRLLIALLPGSGLCFSEWDLMSLWHWARQLSER